MKEVAKKSGGKVGGEDDECERGICNEDGMELDFSSWGLLLCRITTG